MPGGANTTKVVAFFAEVHDTLQQTPMPAFQEPWDVFKKSYQIEAVAEPELVKHMQRVTACARKLLVNAAAEGGIPEPLVAELSAIKGGSTP